MVSTIFCFGLWMLSSLEQNCSRAPGYMSRYKNSDSLECSTSIHESSHSSHLPADFLTFIGPLWWASLAGLSRGHASVSAPKSVSSVSASEPVSSASAQEPVSPTPGPEPPFPAPASTPEPRCSKRILSIPGRSAVLAGRSPRKPRNV
jgi:hypothetical protein